MAKISTLYSNYQELMLDLDIFGSIIKAPPIDEAEYKKLLLEEYKRTHHKASLEDKRYELSDIVSSDYHIAYTSEFELRENEELVEISKANDLSSYNTDVTLEESIEVPQEIKGYFSPDKKITDSKRSSLISELGYFKKDDTIEQFTGDVGIVESIFNTVRENMDNIHTYEDDEEEYIIEDSSDDSDVNIQLENEEYSDDEEVLGDDSNEYSEEDDEEEYLDEDEEEYSDEEDEDEYLDEEEYSDDEEYSDEEDEEEYLDEEDEEEYSDDEDDEDDYDFSSDDSDEDDYDSEDDYDEGDDEYSDDEEYSDETSHEDEEEYIDDENSIEEHSGSEEVQVAKESEGDNQFKNTHKGVSEDSVFDSEGYDGIDFIENDIVVETPKVVLPTQKVVEEVSNPQVNRESEPRTLREFLRKHPHSEVSFVLQYFSKKEIQKEIMMGNVIKKGNKLHI